MVVIKSRPLRTFGILFALAIFLLAGCCLQSSKAWAQEDNGQTIQEHPVPELTFKQPELGYYLVGETEDETSFVKNASDVFGEGDLHSEYGTTSCIKAIESDNPSVFSVTTTSSPESGTSITMEALKSGKAAVTVTDILDRTYRVPVVVKDIGDIDTSRIRFHTPYDDITYLVEGSTIPWGYQFENGDMLHDWLLVESENQDIISSGIDSGNSTAGSLCAKKTGITTLKLWYIQPGQWPSLEGDNKTLLKTIKAQVISHDDYENIFDLAGFPSNTYFPSYMEVGDRLSFLDKNAQLKHALVFESTNPTVVSINDRGEISALKNGEAQLSAKFYSLSYLFSSDGSTHPVTTVVTPTKSVTLSHRNVNLKVGETLQLTAKSLPSTCSYPEVYWEYEYVEGDDDDCITLSDTGLVTAIAPGKARIRVFSLQNPSAFQTCDVTVSARSTTATPPATVTPAKTSIANAAVTVKDKAYTGKTLKPSSVAVKVGGRTLRQGADYTVSCKGGKKIGSYTVTITGKGSYTGTATAKFNVVPKGVTAKKPSAAKRGFTAKWKRPASKYLKQTTGYEVMWATDKKFTKNKKSKLVKGAKKTSLKVTKLKAKKTYYVKVRAYKQVGKAKYYSSWSKVQKVKTKK